MRVGVAVVNGYSGDDYGAMWKQVVAVARVFGGGGAAAAARRM
jgi:hypothetical protein